MTRKRLPLLRADPTGATITFNAADPKECLVLVKAFVRIIAAASSPGRNPLVLS